MARAVESRPYRLEISIEPPVKPGSPELPQSLNFLRLRYSASAVIWTALPSLTLLAFRSSRWETSFRAQPFNNSYDAMFVAAMAGIGATSLWALRLMGRSIRAGATDLPLQLSWRSAFGLFELILSATLAVLNLSVGAKGSGVAWTLAFAALLITTLGLRTRQQNTPLVPRPPRRLVDKLASTLLIAFAFAFIAFPVLQPWSGPPEAFVRWHPFGLGTELIWRGVFLSFAIGMLIAAFDPARRHRLFIVALVLSGYLHSAEMALDNLTSAAMGSMNGNREHLYGDVLGWCTIASLSLVFLASVRKRSLPKHGR